MSIIEDVITPLRAYRAKLLDKYIRKRRFKRTDCCLISNNCWGAMHFYQRFGIKYNTPTVGLFISDTDFIKFCHNLQYYLSQPLKFIQPKSSPTYTEVCRWGNINPDLNDFFYFPVAMIDDVTLWFMHYKSKEEAETKWTRRAARTNIEKVIVKWSQRYTIDDNIVNQFLDIKYPKIGIVDAKCTIESRQLVKLKGWASLRDCGGDEISFTGKNINTISVLNNLL